MFRTMVARSFFPVCVAFGLTKRYYEAHRKEREMAGLRTFLLGLTPPESVGRFCVRVGSVPRIILKGGMYELLYRFKDPCGVSTYVLNLDHAIWKLPVPEWRERVLAAAKDVGVRVLPLSERALKSAMDRSGERHPRLIVREGYEAVFTLGDNYYLSGYDQQEDPPLYFLCQLPGPASSVTEARESLKPESVKSALANGVRVQRQGDLFFIATGMSDEDVTDYMPSWRDFTKPLYGTAHTATCVVQLPSGVMIASGIVRHKPDLIGRKGPADHTDLHLGHGWWLVARNTVPAIAKKPEMDAAGEGTQFVEAPPFSDPFWAYT